MLNRNRFKLFEWLSSIDNMPLQGVNSHFTYDGRYQTLHKITIFLHIRLSSYTYTLQGADYF